MKSLTRAMSLLETIASQREIGIRSLAKVSALPKSTVHRFVSCLEELGYLRQDPKTGNYSLSFKLLRLSLSATENLSIRELVHPFLEELVNKAGEAAHLGTLEGSEVVYIDKVDSFQLLTTVAKVGTRAPAHCSGVGKVLLAFLPKEKREEVISDTGLTRYTRRTITSPEKLEEHLRQVRRQGFAIDNQEWTAGLVSVAAPIKDSTGAVNFAISIAGPSARLKQDKVEELRRLACEVADQINTVYGGGVDGLYRS